MVLKSQMKLIINVICCCCFSFLAHFSTTVGAVHNSNYTMFEIGSYANRGLSQLVLTGETQILEQELANEVS